MVEINVYNCAKYALFPFEWDSYKNKLLFHANSFE